MAVTAAQTLTAEDVRHILGDLTDVTVDAILGTGATVADLEAARCSDSAEDDTFDVPRLSPPASAVRQILAEDSGWPEDDDGA